MARLMTRYREEILPALKQELGRDNPHACPKLEKIVISMGLGKALQDRKRLEEAMEHLTLLAGQKPHICRSRKSVAGFRLREGMEVGIRVTLRGKRMYEFFDRLITLALPRVRDFRGLNPKAFDRRGNYNMGLSEQMVFPEVPADDAKFTQGLNITFVTTASNDADARVLMEKMGLPFRKEEVKTR